MRTVLLTIFAAAVIACDEGTPPRTQTVQATPEISFVPGQIDIAENGTVTWVFGPVPHNVFFAPAAAGRPEDIASNNTNVSISRVFSTPGTYAYECRIHPGMRGTVTVRRSSALGY